MNKQQSGRATMGNRASASNQALTAPGGSEDRHGVRAGKRPAGNFRKPGAFRKLWPTEHDKLRNHLLRLDRESRRLRFAHSVTDAFIDDYAARMNDMGGLVHGYFENGELHAVAELRKLGLGWGSEAEVAFSVEAAYQNLGIGSELMGRVIRSARNRGISHLYMSCLAENSRIQHIAKKHKADIKIEYGDVVGDILPKAPDYFSMISEALEDRVGYMMAVLDLGQRQLQQRDQ